jgi:hypothetical protein
MNVTKQEQQEVTPSGILLQSLQVWHKLAMFLHEV